MFDHGHYLHNLRSCEIKAWKKTIIQTCTGFQPISFFRLYFHRLRASDDQSFLPLFRNSNIWPYKYSLVHKKVVSITCERRSSDRRNGHEEELNTDACGYLVHTNDIRAQNGQENHEKTIKHTKNNHVHNETGVTFSQRAQSVCHADDQHRYLEAIESVHSRVVTEFAEEEPTESRAYGHHTDQSGRLWVWYAALLGVSRLWKKKKKPLLINFKALLQAVGKLQVFTVKGHTQMYSLWVHKITYQMDKRNEISHHKSAQRKAVNQECFILENSEVKHWRPLAYGFFHCFLHFFTTLTGHFIQQGPNGAQTQYASKHPRCVGPS